MPPPHVNSPAGYIKNTIISVDYKRYRISGSNLRQGLPAAMSSRYQGAQAHTAVFVVPIACSHPHPATLPQPFPKTHPVPRGNN